MFVLLFFGVILVGFGALIVAAAFIDRKEEQQRADEWLNGYKAIVGKYGSAFAPRARYELWKYPAAPKISTARVSDEFRFCADQHHRVLLQGLLMRLRIQIMMDQHRERMRYSEYNNYI